MYNADDLIEIRSQLKKISFIIAGVFIAFLIGAIFIAKMVANKLGLVVMIVGVCVDVFIWGIYGSAIFAYYVFLKNLATGRTTLIKGIVKSVSSNPIYKDNKLFYYEVTIDEDGIERVVLLDDNKEWPRLEFNRAYEFKMYENYVRSAMPIT